MAFAAIDYDALLIMNQKLSPLEFQAFSACKMEEFFGGGICTLSVKELCVKYKFKSYDNLTVVCATLVKMNWLIKTPEGIRCQDDFTKVLDRPPGKKAKNPSSDQNFLPENPPPTENISVEAEEKLRNSKLPTENNSVSDLEILSSNSPPKEYLNTQETGKEPVFVPHTAFARKCEGGCVPKIDLPSKIPKPGKRARRNSKNPGFRKPRKPDPAFERMAAVCFLKRSAAELRTLSGKERGQLNQNLKKLRGADTDFSQMPNFETWWKNNWRSGTNEGNYEPPRPDQVVLFWHVAQQAEQIVREARTAGKPAWTTVGKSTAEAANFSGEPEPRPKQKLDEALADFRQLKAAGAIENFDDWEKFYTPEDWQWLMKKLDQGEG